MAQSWSVKLSLDPGPDPDHRAPPSHIHKASGRSSRSDGSGSGPRTVVAGTQGPQGAEELYLQLDKARDAAISQPPNTAGI